MYSKSNFFIFSIIIYTVFTSSIVNSSISSISNMSSNQNISEKFMIENRQGGFNYFELSIPNTYLRVFIESNIDYYGEKNEQKINYTITGKILPVRSNSKYNFYGLFIPFNLYDNIYKIDFSYSIYVSESLLLSKTSEYIVEPVTWAEQNIFFNKSQSNTVKNSTIKTFNEENKVRHELWRKKNETPFFLSGFIHPLDNESRVSSAFGLKRKWILSNGKVHLENIHNGIDYPKPVGTPIKAVADGVIVYIKNAEYLGKTVIIDHGFFVFTDYSHLSSIFVEVGDILKQGDIIGTVGATGTATGPHLHWGVRINNFPVNPADLFNITFNNK